MWTIWSNLYLANLDNLRLTFSQKQKSHFCVNLSNLWSIARQIEQSMYYRMRYNLLILSCFLRVLQQSFWILVVKKLCSFKACDICWDSDGYDTFIWKQTSKLTLSRFNISSWNFDTSCLKISSKSNDRKQKEN